jgi:hypothetical protein
MVQTPLRFWLETFNKLNVSQAGFKANRSTEEQVARVTQFAMDSQRQGIMPKMRAMETPACIYL